MGARKFQRRSESLQEEIQEARIIFMLAQLIFKGKMALSR